MPTRWHLVALTAALGLTSTLAGASPSRVRYDGHVVVRVDLKSRAELDMVLGIAADVWSERIGVGPLDVMLDRDGLAALDASGLDYLTVVDDVQLLVDEELDRLSASSVAGPAGVWFDDYRDYAEANSYLSWLASSRPDLATVFEVGQSIEGRTIHGIRISGPGDDKPAVLLNGCQHAREWITVMVTTCIADRLVSGYDGDPTIQSLVDDLEFVIVPIVNPDGYEYTWEVDRFWRKNRRDGHGVDLNRNWGVAWGKEPGSSGNPESGNYRGEAPFSEPETASVRDLVLANDGIVVHIDFHSYGQLILHPWGFDYLAAPAADTLKMLGEMLQEAILGAHGESYASIQGVEFYPAAGIAPDWTYGERGIYGFTIELRPDREEEIPNGFVLPPEEIIPTCEESLAAVIELASWSAGREPAEPGGNPWVPDTGTDTSTDTDTGGGTTDGSHGETDEGTSSDEGGSHGETSGTSGDPGDDTDSAPGQEAVVSRACVCRGDRSGGGGMLPLAAGLLACTLRRRRQRRADTDPPRVDMS